MGKRSKSVVDTNAVKNKKNKLEDNDVAEQSDLTVINVNTKNAKTKTKKKKAKKSKVENETLTVVEDLETDCLTAETDDVVDKKALDDKVIADLNEEIQETSKTNIEDKTVKVNKQKPKSEKKSKKLDFSQEDDVKDEDIDQFCDEIDEEDNLQYLNWVEQIEAKLKSNIKKKPK